jgi:hypothetical protein
VISGSTEVGRILGRVTATRESGMVLLIENGMKIPQRKERRSERV